MTAEATDKSSTFRGLATAGLIGLAAAIAAGLLSTPDASKALVDKPAPGFSGRLLDGKELSLGGLKGRVVVLDFWATWCPPCRLSIPKVQALSERFASEPVTVLGINLDMDETGETVRDFVKEHSIRFPQLLGGTEVAKKYGVEGIPCTVVVDRSGVVRHVSTGYSEGQEEELAELVRKLLS